MTKEELRKAFVSGKISAEEFDKQYAALCAPLEKGLIIKVAKGGGASLYNLQRMPVTLYAEQWSRLLDFGDKIRDFLKANAAALELKADSDDVKAAKARHPLRVAAIEKAAENAAAKAKATAS